MKYLLFLSVLLPASAYSQSGEQVVHEVATSTNSLVQTASLCNSTAAANITALTSSGTVVGAFSVEVYNPAASTSTINCGFDLALSSAITSVWYGREVAAGIGVVWKVLTNRTLYCITQNSGGCTRVTVTQMK